MHEIVHFHVFLLKGSYYLCPSDNLRYLSYDCYVEGTADVCVGVKSEISALRRILENTSGASKEIFGGMGELMIGGRFVDED